MARAWVSPTYRQGVEAVNVIDRVAPTPKREAKRVSLYDPAAGVVDAATSRNTSTPTAAATNATNARRTALDTEPTSLETRVDRSTSQSRVTTKGNAPNGASSVLQ